MNFKQIERVAGIETTLYMLMVVSFITWLVTVVATFVFSFDVKTMVLTGIYTLVVAGIYKIYENKLERELKKYLKNRG